MISLLSSISPTARALLGEHEYRFEVSVRHSSGANCAYCHGARASSTNSPEIAANAAALKHWNRFLGTSGIDGRAYVQTLKPLGQGLFLAVFKLKEDA